MPILKSCLERILEKKYAHGLSEKRGYIPGVKYDHYNIDIAQRSFPGTTVERWNNIHVFHIVVDTFGNVTDFY